MAAASKRFTTISDALAVAAERRAKGGKDVFFDIVAAVAEIGSAYRSAGTDHCIRLRLVDESYQGTGTTVCFFAIDPTQLPDVRSTGDVVVLFGALVKLYEGNPYFWLPKNRPFAIFAGGASNETEPYQTYPGFQLWGDEIRRVSKLRTLFQGTPANKELMDAERTLCSLEPDCTCDIVCKILHIFSNVDGKKILYIWDGTDTPSIPVRGGLNSKDLPPIPLHIDEEPSLPMEILNKFPPHASILKVLCHMDVKVPSAEGMYWARLCNVLCQHQHGLWKGSFEPQGYIRVLSTKDCSVVSRERMFSERMVSLEAEIQNSTNVASNVLEIEEQLVAAKLREFLCGSLAVPQCKSMVKVVDISRDPAGFRLTLEDPTTRIHAYILREDFLYFFGADKEAIAAKLRELLGGEDDPDIGSPRNPPNVWIGLRAVDETFVVFGTKLSRTGQNSKVDGGFALHG